MNIWNVSITSQESCHSSHVKMVHTLGLKLMKVGLLNKIQLWNVASSTTTKNNYLEMVWVCYMETTSASGWSILMSKYNSGWAFNWVGKRGLVLAVSPLLSTLSSLVTQHTCCYWISRRLAAFVRNNDVSHYTFIYKTAISYFAPYNNKRFLYLAELPDSNIKSYLFFLLTE